MRSVSLGYGAIRAMRNLSITIALTAGVVQAETVTVAALGDSLTAGYGLATADGFVPQMQAWLDAQGIDARLVNAGVSGDTTAGGLSRTDWTLTDDVDAMIVALGGNDYLRGMDPQVSRANLAGILDKASASDVDVLLVGLVAGGNYGPDYKQAFDAMYPDLAREYDVAYYPRWFAGIVAVAGMEDDLAAYMQADGIHPNAEGVKLIVDAMGPWVAALVAQAAS